MTTSNDPVDHNDDELYEHHSFIVDKGQTPLRIDKYLMNFIENATRNKIQAAAKDGSIYVNDVPVKQNYKVKPNDSIRVLFEHPPYEYLLTPEDIPLNIIYEDDELIVLNKPAGMVVHPGHGNYSGTLINALIYHFENLPNNSSNRPGLVHRIDKDTSGLLVVAKTEESMTHLSRQFFNKTSEREYVALVWGNVTENEGTIEGHIGRHPKNRLQNTVFEGDEEEKGKPAVTHYKVIERLGYVTLVSCKLETGRTHQIRVHMKHIGHTLFHDERYGGDRILKGTTFSKYKQFVENCFKILPRQALHAKTLGFEHPKTGKQLRFDSELPEDMSLCIEKWRNYTKHQD
ncbi:RluA family pseudouridine synthase [Psychroserpens sp.]|uniref:RluA family pseudouridine synthase n=1 Tax=Psychroserpens sp. TaxID=2020870 RepID=UPI001B0B5388|nr:RluA family pseudouridine synthase [Psychroserpens sp.]MBO6606024.1 RluA family pseudouridine synthase [Psychroserpens sp.]MBO6652605.1 RluA family pseudouridine synthase [Psychroserpens sp.]MBO6681623.1 RluA family pseudouridine synthase [Psychroserpens sp.]MBO6749398.1 RluA family pseudouridine synthase [Psychroserpens sp.]MBO6914156.1 RluA family pseudouridine synthase [Psychroserpens sp.]